MCGPTTVNALRATSNATGSITTQVGHELRHLMRLQQAANRPLRHHNLLHHLRLRDAVYPRLILDLLLHQGCAYVRWTDGVTGHTVFRRFESRYTRQP